MKNLFCFLLVTTIICCQKDDDAIIKSVVTDIDGNGYDTVTIGTQVWLVENLKTTKYRNGVPILNLIDDLYWSFDTTGAYCNYNRDANSVKTYGYLYNWYSITNTNNLAPEGWHIPTDAEWTTLINYLGGENVAGGKLKEAGLAHWWRGSTPEDATNETGFTALPGGFRDQNGAFFSLGGIGFWWSVTENTAIEVWSRHIHYNYVRVDRVGAHKKYGYSVRCIKD